MSQPVFSIVSIRSLAWVLAALILCIGLNPKDCSAVDKPAEKNGKEPDAIEFKPGENLEDTVKQAQAGFSKNFRKQKIEPLGEKEMKEFLDKRLDELNKKIGGKWRLIETKHFYCFSNQAEAKHKLLAVDWLETSSGADGTPGIYPLLCSVLRHKEGDKLWNNKCPLYFFEKYSEFQNFAAAIDNSPGSGQSGGYFAARGREVHICIPFMTQRLGEKAADRQARNTLYHEGTHAFLQLTGEDVPITRWMHEGLAQFIEFWFDPKNNTSRQNVCRMINQDIKNGGVPSWAEMKERPQGGMDLQGYAWAWIKMEFLYRNADNQRLPTMIRFVKSGKTEENAFLETFKLPVDKIETLFQGWVKDKAAHGFTF